MVQSALDDVYKDMGSVTDQLSTRISGMRKLVHTNKDLVEKLSAKFTKKKSAQETAVGKIGLPST
jgi:hypothetical protein